MLRLKALREAKPMTQAELAQALGTTQQTVARWEAGSVVPTVQTVIQIADLFEVSVDEILDRAERNKPWSRDELKLALELYMINPASPPGKGSEEVFEVSLTLNKMAQWLGYPGSETFRNVNGVYMKVMNFRRFDPLFMNDGKVGLQRGNKLEEVIWQQYTGKRDQLIADCAAIRSAIEQPIPAEAINDDDVEGYEADEGRVLTRVHRYRERSRKLVDKRKEQVLASGHKLCCEACGFEFGAVYGERGEGYVEAHHIVPLHTISEVKKTRPEDLALVCANCHRMIHRRSPWLTIEELKVLLGK